MQSRDFRPANIYGYDIEKLNNSHTATDSQRGSGNHGEALSCYKEMVRRQLRLENLPLPCGREGDLGQGTLQKTLQAFAERAMLDTALQHQQRRNAALAAHVAGGDWARAAAAYEAMQRRGIADFESRRGTSDALLRASHDALYAVC